jgi:hypothetical protein
MDGWESDKNPYCMTQQFIIYMYASKLICFDVLVYFL